MKKSNGHLLAEKPWLPFGILILASVTCALLLIAVGRTLSSSAPLLCSLNAAYASSEAAAISADYATTPTQLLAIFHYATSRQIPQQSPMEIRVAFDILKELAPCNLLVFGLGHDSLMWASLNARGTTLFLEEDPAWLHATLRNAPVLRAHFVAYRTRLSQADELRSYYKFDPHCLPPNIRLKGNKQCKLALSELPEEVYEKDWDIIMIDGPKGFYPEAPGRMGPIYSAAVMAQRRKNWGVTHVFLHDVERKVEKEYAAEFLCRKYLVKSVGRLWHFAIPPAPNVTDATAAAYNSTFC
ncbi:hypothetical protein SLE2022_001090 [Rubroshorea leprosula]